METSDHFKEEISKYLSEPRFIEVLKSLKVAPTLKGIEEYLEIYPIKDLAEERFLRSVNSYLENEGLPRYKNGLVNSTDMLMIYSKEQLKGLRTSGKYLGQDGKKYIIKMAEGVRDGIEDGIYNPTMAQAVFQFLGEKAAECIPSYEGRLYYYIVSRDFLEENQSLVQLSSLEINNKSPENSIKHGEIISVIESYIRERQKGKMPDNVIEEECKNARLDYAIQETIKDLICSADQNLGNTSLVITNLGDRKETISISPAYDMDLSFNMGERILHLHGNRNNNKFYRTTENGETSLNEIVKEFSETVPGYVDRLGNILKKLDDNYIDRIMSKAYEITNVSYFQGDEAREKYACILMRKVAELKQAFKLLEQKTRSED